MQPMWQGCSAPKGTVTHKLRAAGLGEVPDILLWLMIEMWQVSHIAFLRVLFYLFLRQDLTLYTRLFGISSCLSLLDSGSMGLWLGLEISLLLLNGQADNGLSGWKVLQMWKKPTLLQSSKDARIPDFGSKPQSFLLPPLMFPIPTKPICWGLSETSVVV